MIVLLLFLAAAYSGWSIGANDSGNCVGTIVGGGVISFRKAIILVAVFVVLGAVLQGQKVMKTVGKGIIISSSQSYQATHHHPPPADFNKYFPTEKIPDLGIFVALLSAAIFVSLATYSSIPVSTSQSIVGGVAGVGLGIVGFQAQYFKIGMLVHILGSWVICPLMTMILAFLIYALLNKILQRAKNFYAWNGVLKVMVIMAAAYSAYSLGANDVGNAIGPILNKYPDKGFYLTIFGGLVLAIGGLTFSRRVCETVGKNITPLDLPGAFAAQISGAFGIHLFSMMGIPVSTSQAIVGAVIGVGLVKSVKAVSRKTVIQIMIGWVATPACAAIFAAVLYRILASLL
jgi:PiT family inorganic phosphate transporter